MDWSVLHPKLVHFPVALFALGWVFDLAGTLRSSDSMIRAGFLNLIAAAIFAVPVVLTGLAAAGNVPPTGAVRDPFDLHQTLAFVSSAAMVGLCMWRVGKRGAIPGNTPWAYLGLGLAGVLAVLVTAHIGGRLVFEYGTGVQLSH